jgi:hypothetical protein
VGGLRFSPKMRKNSKPEKYLKMPQNPTNPVHALLGADELEDSLTEKNIANNALIFYGL